MYGLRALLRSDSVRRLGACELAVELKVVAYEARHQEVLADRGSRCHADIMRQARVCQESHNVLGAALSRLDQVPIVPVLDLHPDAAGVATTGRAFQKVPTRASCGIDKLKPQAK